MSPARSRARRISRERDSLALLSQDYSQSSELLGTLDTNLEDIQVLACSMQTAKYSQEVYTGKRQ